MIKFTNTVSWSTLFILSKRDDDLIVMQNVRLSFDKIDVIILLVPFSIRLQITW